jgi:hypothetical protein
MHRLLTSTRKILDADVIKASVRRSSLLLRAADVLSNVMQDPRIPESLRAYLSDKIRDDAPKDAAATARVVAWLDANAHELNKCKSDLARLTAVTHVVGPSPDEEATVDAELVAACQADLKRARRLLASASRKRGGMVNGKRPRPSFTAPPRCRRLVVVPPPPPLQLPPGWEQRFDERSKKIFFVDHNTCTTSWEDPRTAKPRPAAADDADADDYPPLRDPERERERDYPPPRDPRDDPYGRDPYDRPPPPRDPRDLAPRDPYDRPPTRDPYDRPRCKCTRPAPRAVLSPDLYCCCCLPRVRRVPHLHLLRMAGCALRSVLTARPTRASRRRLRATTHGDIQQQKLDFAHSGGHKYKYGERDLWLPNWREEVVGMSSRVCAGLGFALVRDVHVCGGTM